jgi:hypothetical protein
LARLAPEALVPDDGLVDERLLDELDELDRFEPPLALPVLRRSAILAPPLAACLNSSSNGD